MSDITHVTAGDDEMANMAQRFFTKASDAIVQASRLAKVVEDLQAQVASLTARIDSVVAENEQLRNELGQVRAERDDYRLRLGQSETEHNQTKAEFEAHKTQAAQTLADTQTAANAVLEELQGRFDSLNRGHEYTTLVLDATTTSLNEVTAKANDLQAKLDEALVKLDAIASIVAKPEAKPTEPVQEAAPLTDPTASSESLVTEEQPRGENGQFGEMPMAAREFQY